MESRPSSKQDHTQPGDIKNASTPVSATLSMHDELQIEARTNVDNKVLGPGKKVAMADNEEFERSNSRGLRRKDSKWEVLTNLETGTQYTILPKKSEGYLAKRRRWPLKGWHKRYVCQKMPDKVMAVGCIIKNCVL